MEKINTSKKIKVLFLLGDSCFGGTATMMAELMNKINKDQFEVYLASPKGEMLESLSEKPAKTLILPGDGRLALFALFPIIRFIPITDVMRSNPGFNT